MCGDGAASACRQATRACVAPSCIVEWCATCAPNPALPRFAGESALPSPACGGGLGLGNYLALLRLQLIANRQLADPFARRRENRIADRRRDRWNGWLADSAERPRVVGWNQVHADI